MGQRAGVRVSRLGGSGFLGLLLGLLCLPLLGQEPKPAEIPPQGATSTAQSTSSSPQAEKPKNEAEVASRDTAPTFKVHVNLVLVRVVVRDAQGHVVTGLHKEDFQVFDNRKLQVVSSFSVETRESRPPVSATTTASGEPAAPDSEGAVPVKFPERFVAVVFDDAHLSMQDAVYVRVAATKLFAALAPSDRVGIFSTSGQVAQEFTDDHELLKKALAEVISRPVVQEDINRCPDLSYYQADLIENRHDTEALAVATEDAIHCAFQGDQSQAAEAQRLAQSMAVRAVTTGDTETERALRNLEDAMRSTARMPGQRVMVFVSPGFLSTTLQLEFSEIVDRATRAGIVINTIDARGLYTPDLLGDIAEPTRDSFRTTGYKTTYRIQAQNAQSDVLAQFADGTGGTFFHNRNDVDEGLKEAAAAPKLSYLLGFSPQNLKNDGRYHTLHVALAGRQKYILQARRGYFAPRTSANPAEMAKEEIQEAILSQEEISNLPIQLQTQFFKTEASAARLAVLTHVDIKGIHFRKADGRNRDDLTFATAIFDQNGNYITGGEKIVEMKLLDTTYERLMRSGLTVKSSFEIKPGSYLVRLVVRDSEGAQLAAKNGAVVIPY
jgi:VWFA-related protein